MQTLSNRGDIREDDPFAGPVRRASRHPLGRVIFDITECVHDAERRVELGHERACEIEDEATEPMWPDDDIVLARRIEAASALRCAQRARWASRRRCSTVPRSSSPRARSSRRRIVATTTSSSSSDDEPPPRPGEPDLRYGIKITRAIDELEAEGLELDRFARALLIAQLTRESCGVSRRGAAS